MQETRFQRAPEKIKDFNITYQHYLCYHDFSCSDIGIYLPLLGAGLSHFHEITFGQNDHPCVGINNSAAPKLGHINSYMKYKI